MANFEVVLLNQAKKFYQKCFQDFVKKLNKCFEDLEDNPFQGPHIKLLKSPKNRRAYRYRIGDYRIIYDVEKERKIVAVHLILPRSQAYRSF